MRYRIGASLIALAGAASLAACSEPGEPVNAAINEDLNTDTATAPAQAAGANSFTEEQAREQIANAGYSDVSDLVLTENGLWQGTAMLGGERTGVSVDYRGAVTDMAQGAATTTLADRGGQPGPAAGEQRASARPQTIEPVAPATVVADREREMAAPSVTDRATPASATAMDRPDAISADVRQAGERG